MDTTESDQWQGRWLGSILKTGSVVEMVGNFGVAVVAGVKRRIGYFAYCRLLTASPSASIFRRQTPDSSLNSALENTFWASFRRNAAGLFFKSDNVSKQSRCEACNVPAWLTQHPYKALLILHIERGWIANDTEIEKASKWVREVRGALWWPQLEGGSWLVSRGGVDRDLGLEDGEKGFKRRGKRLEWSLT